jgi:hypothetical protein
MHRSGESVASCWLPVAGWGEPAVDESTISGNYNWRLSPLAIRLTATLTAYAFDTAFMG